MLKRASAGVLWYAMAWVAYEIAWSMIGLPRSMGPIVAASVAMLVVVDPLHLLWPRTKAMGEAPSVRIKTLDATALNSR